MGGIDAGVALHLVCESAVLIACLEQLAPDFMEGFMVLLQLLPMLFSNLHRWPCLRH